MAAFVAGSMGPPWRRSRCQFLYAWMANVSDAFYLRGTTIAMMESKMGTHVGCFLVVIMGATPTAPTCQRRGSLRVTAGDVGRGGRHYATL